MTKMLLRVLFSIHFLSITWYSFSQSAGKYSKEGKELAQQGKSDEAINRFTKAIELKPTDDELYLERAKEYEKKKELVKAIADYDKALIINSKDEKVYLKAAELKIQLKLWPQAMFDLDRVMENDKSNIEAYEQKAWCLINTKKFEEALAICEAALLKNQYNHRLHYLKGMSKDSLKDYPVAVVEYQRAVTIMKGIKPNDVKPLPVFKTYFTNLAMAQTRTALYDEAIKNYSTAATLDAGDTIAPQNFKIFYYRSFPYLLKNDFTNAIGDLTKAVVMNEKDRDAIYQRGVVYQITSQFQSAINDFTKSLQLDDKYAEAYRNRGKCYLEASNYKAAIADFSKSAAISNNPEDIKMLADTKQKLYDANRESDAPDIKIEYPLIDLNNFINVFDNQIDLVIEGYVKDKSQIEFIKINGVIVKYNEAELNPEFKCHILLKADLRKLEITVSDIYHNVSSKTIKVGRIINDSKVRVTFAGKILSDDGNKLPFQNREIYLVNDKGEIFFKSKTDPDGRFKFDNLPYDQGYFLTMDVTDSPLAKAPKFMITDEAGTPVLVSAEDGKQKFKFQILPSDYSAMSLMTLDDAPLLVDIKGKLIAGNENKTPISNITVILMNEKGEAVASKKTDGLGAFLFSRMAPRTNYTIKTDSVESKNIKENKILITDENGKIIKELMRNPSGYFQYRLLPADKAQLVKISATDPWLKALKLSKDKSEMLIIENVYYASGSFDILPEAEVLIDKAVEALKSNAKLIIEVQAHTDAVAGDEYNMELSQKRAKTVVEYMTAKGIDKRRVTGKGFGETELTNKCVNGFECSDAEHKQNRRTVFKISYIGN
ncbi:MAG TPA: tetratricopeptide repeat protein [Bacteroidia bacterium]|jgi:tetratricopeptide (TPR) repeat protein/outer membrane protein OmpA-like peptidoglycan-associated protein